MPLQSFRTSPWVSLAGMELWQGSRSPLLLCRDIKPENIVLEGGKAGGQVRLVDFGGVQAAARSAEGTGSPGTTVIGEDREFTLSPEQVWWFVITGQVS